VELFIMAFQVKLSFIPYLHPILTFLGVGNITSLVRNTIIGAIFLVYRFKNEHKNKQQIFQKKPN
jgi:hypothetical protein